MQFDVEKGQLGVNFTQAEIDRLTGASGDQVAFRGAVDEIIDTNRPSDDCCRPVLYDRLPYEALRAVRQSRQVESSTLSAAQADLLGAMVGLSMFGPRAVIGQSPREEAVA